MAYSTHFNKRETSQRQPIPGSGQVQNNAGGYAWEIDDWARLHRFLILGSEGGTYYANERDLTIGNCEAAMHCLSEDGHRVVRMVTDISTGRRAPKNDPALFVLAMAAGDADPSVRRAALDALPQVARIGTHLFHFAEYVKAFRGWGPGLKRAVQGWYLDKDEDQLAYQMIKYQQRDGWSHRDLLRLAHPEPDTATRDAMFGWACYDATFDPAEMPEGTAERRDLFGDFPVRDDLPELMETFERMKRVENEDEVLQILEDTPHYPWEAIPSEWLGGPAVWQALAPNLPMTACLRNLARMTSSGAMTAGNDTTKVVVEKLSDGENLRKAGVHPLSVLNALNTYQGGSGFRGSLSWDPIRQVIDALDDAFYAAFGNVEGTGQRYVLGLDVSGSMTFETISGMPGITPRVGSAAMAMVTARTEPEYHFMGFCKEFVPLNISARDRLDRVVNEISDLPFGGTDCAQPMLWALDNDVEADVFIVYTDNQTWAGDIHPTQALQRYREQTGIPAKLIVVGMTSNGFSIADPDDGGMLDVVGMDTATPNLMSDFARGGFSPNE